MEKRISIALGLWLSLVLGSTPALAAKPETILARPGGSFDERELDRFNCVGAGLNARLQDLPSTTSPQNVVLRGATGPRAPVPYIPTPVVAGVSPAAMAAGGLVAVVVISSLSESFARDHAADWCMANLGYVEVPLTPEEAAGHGKGSVEKRNAWDAAFLAGNITARVAAVRPLAVPALPPYIDAPGVQGGLKIDLGALTPTAGPVSASAVLISGKVTRWRTAQLATDLSETADKIQITAPAGTVFHQVDYRTQETDLMRDSSPTWCGPVTETLVAPATDAKAQAKVYCFTSKDNFYIASPAKGYGWLAAPPTANDGPEVSVKQPIELTERETDDLGPVDLRIWVTRVLSGQVALAAQVSGPDGSVDLWIRDLKFDKAGTAILPLWSKRAVITKSGPASVTVKIDDKGDGHGWRPGD